MKKIFQMLACTLALMLVFSLCPAAVFAAEPTPYTYTVTLAVGRQGTLAASYESSIQVENSAYTLSSGNGIITISGLSRSARVGFQPDVASLDESSKYYVKGVRLSGRDNTSVDASSFAVTADADYVVAYGIKGDLAQYTVNYQDTAGNALAPSRSYYGNVGDKPVIAYLYIDGYQPQSYNLTKTLVTNSTENIFTFVYNRLPASGNNGGGDDDGGSPTPTATPGDIIIYVTPSPVPGGTATRNPGAASSEAQDNDDNGDEANNTPEEEVQVIEVTPEPGANNGNGNGGNGGNAAGDGTGDEALGAPEELTNIDGNQTPLASLAKKIIEAVSNASPVAIVGGVAIAGALLLLLILLLLKKRKDKKKDEQDSAE